MSSQAIRRARLLLVVVVLAWFFSPPAWRYAVPLWLPFVLALGLEIEFLVGGLVRPGPAVIPSGLATSDRVGTCVTRPASVTRAICVGSLSSVIQTLPSGPLAI